MRERFPAAHITYIVEPAAAAIVERNPHITQVIVAPKKAGPLQLAADLELARQLRSARYDVAIDFHGGPRSSLLTWLSGAPVRIGYDVAGRSWMYTHRVRRPRVLRPRHSVENQWDLLTALDIAKPDRSTFPVEMPVDPDAARNEVTRRMMAQAPVEAKIQAADFVIDNSGSVEGTRRQVEDIFRKLASKATARTA